MRHVLYCYPQLDASYFRVPQRRQRLIFIGVRSDLDTDAVHPRAVSTPLTVRSAFADLDDPGYSPPLKHKQAVLAPLIEPGRNGSHVLAARGYKASYYSFRRLDWNRPASTVEKEQHVSGGLLHPVNNRLVGTRELTRLQSFPDTFDWGADTSYRDLLARVGNSVPPLLMRAVAQTIRDRILT